MGAKSACTCAAPSIQQAWSLQLTMLWCSDSDDASVVDSDAAEEEGSEDEDEEEEEEGKDWDELEEEAKRY